MKQGLPQLKFPFPWFRILLWSPILAHSDPPARDVLAEKLAQLVGKTGARLAPSQALGDILVPCAFQLPDISPGGKSSRTKLGLQVYKLSWTEHFLKNQHGPTISEYYY